VATTCSKSPLSSTSSSASACTRSSSDKLWDQGVRFGVGINQGKHLVLIDPGFSRLTARQILNRLIGNP
jgi:hypothetical protein